MSGKDQKPSKKAKREKQKKAIEDSTFGLKNKNKSKKVQQFITRVEKSVKNSNVEAVKAKELKKDAKIAKQLQEEEMRQLFNEAIGNQFGVKKSKAQSNAQMLGLTAAKKEVTDFLDTLSTDSDDSDSEEENPYRRKYNQIVEAEDDNEPNSIEVFREKTIEDIIEEQRAKLAAEGKKGTPVTAESFAKWRAEKLAKKQAEIEAKVKAEQTKKKGGKGLSVLSGKELFSYNASLFVDDESAFDTSNDKTIDDEIKALAAAEDVKIKEEAAKAQAEQLRLFELQKIEIEARKAREEEKKRQALAPSAPRFIFQGVRVNVVVFTEDEDEDLELFPEIPFGPKSVPKSEEGGDQGVQDVTEAVGKVNLVDGEGNGDAEEEDDGGDDDNEEDDGDGEDGDVGEEDES